ncbi:hypothetical protein D9Q98_008496 [Chlorella vulgaris]|uniref:Uncharacterized protein n=1 Tax=Chlorella vulgaris TaxID=3077 RepID=A0A9D4TI69_CHLVU|nr:hypothetical protein D9Q98_008496 [Chlorella vulgaris]
MAQPPLKSPFSSVSALGNHNQQQPDDPVEPVRVSLLRSIDALIASAPPNPALGRSQSQADAPATQAIAIWHPTALLLAASAADSGGGCGSGQVDSSLQQLSRFFNHKAPIPTQSLSGGRVGRPDVPAHGAAPRAGSLKRSRSPSAFQPYPATSPTEAGSLLGPAQCLPADPGMRSDASGETLLLAGSASFEARMSACTEPEAHGSSGSLSDVDVFVAGLEFVQAGMPEADVRKLQSARSFLSSFPSGPTRA